MSAQGKEEKDDFATAVMGGGRKETRNNSREISDTTTRTHCRLHKDDTGLGEELFVPHARRHRTAVTTSKLMGDLARFH